MSAAPVRQATALPAYAPGRRRQHRPMPARNRQPHHGVSGSARRTASVVSHLPESTAVIGISRSRVCIAVIGVLLIWSVAITVMSVSYGSMSGRLQN